jgi:hypothetical protein
MTSACRNAEVRSAHAAKQGVSYRADNVCAGSASATPVAGDFNNLSRKKLVNGAAVFRKDAGQIIRNGNASTRSVVSRRTRCGRPLPSIT